MWRQNWHNPNNNGKPTTACIKHAALLHAHMAQTTINYQAHSPGYSFQLLYHHETSNTDCITRKKSINNLVITAQLQGVI
jgi:hypothetical protein